MTLAVLLFAVSANAGEAVTIATGRDGDSPRQPQAAVSANGTVHVVYGVGNVVYHSDSTDGGGHFSKPAMAFECPNMSLGKRRGPRVATSGDALVVTAIGGALGKGKDGDLLAWRCGADGKWTGPARVNDVADAAREGLHAMASGPDGTLWCCWLDLREKGTQLFLSNSTDGGGSWSPNKLVYRSPEGTICQCCHPSMAIGSDGRVQVLFRNALDGNRDMYLVTATRDGEFGSAMKLGQGNWPLKGCPMDGGMLAIDASGNVDTAWRRVDDVFLSTGKSERRLGRGLQPWIAATNAGPKVAWVEKADGKLFLFSAATGKTEALSEHGRDAVIVALPGGSRTFVCWESFADPERSIVGQVLE